MPARLADRLSAARRSRFVGRDQERALLESALTEAEPSFHLFYIYGPGGVGKTALLAEFRQRCAAAGLALAALDGRDLEPTPDAFNAAFNRALDRPAEAAAPARLALLIDTYELLNPLDGWLRDVFLPALPETAITVVAARNPPASAWRADPGWQSVLSLLPLRNLAPEESRSFLEARNVPPDQHAAVLQFTHGYPLALSLVADEFAQRPGALRSFAPEAAPDVVKALLERFVQKVPSPAHRAALEACVLVRLTTEPLLAAMLGAPDANELFNWLRDLSFVESGPQGLFPHDLAREALAADLRWRNPDWFNELHKRARAYYAGRVTAAGGAAQQRNMADYIFLHRDSPAVRPFIDWQTSGSLMVDGLREGDAEALRAMTAEHEGDESARLLTAWLGRQPQGALVYRESDGKPAGFLFMLNLAAAGSADLAADPAAAAARAHLDRAAPLRPGETATLFRFWMAREGYQGVSAVQSMVFINAVLHYLTTPGLVHTYFPCAEPGFWAPVFAYADLEHLPEADFETAGRRYGMFGHNWRRTPPAGWLALLAERETGRGAETARPASAETVVVLSEPEFAAAVRDALRDFSRPDALAGNPLVQSRLVLDAAGPGSGRAERAASLQNLIHSAAGQLKSSPREIKFYRALQHTYLQPAETQERAAELLDLPFSTYRRHLKTGIDRLVELLWARELQGPAA